MGMPIMRIRTLFQSAANWLTKYDWASDTRTGSDSHSRTNVVKFSEAAESSLAVE